jgi:O-glycosyl hydrolase
MHLRQVSNGQEPTWLGQKPLAWWEVCEEIEFLMSYGMSTVAITEALKTSYESLTQRLREHDNAKPILQNLMARRNQEIGREPAAH